MAPKLEIRRTLVLSTAHIQGNTAKRLEAENTPGLRVQTVAYGWELRVPDPNGDYAVGSQADIMEMPEFGAIFALARENKCTHVLLDCDGDTTEQLLEFEW